MNYYLPQFLRLALCIALMVGAESAFAQRLASRQAAYAPGPNQQDAKQPLHEALEKLGQQHQVRFSFDRKVVEEKFVKEDDISSRDLYETLDRVLTPLQLKYEKIDAVHFVIVPKKEAPRTIERLDKKTVRTSHSTSTAVPPVIPYSPLSTHHATTSVEKTITGRVTDLSTNEGLPGVNIVVKNTTAGTVTDIDGNYRLTMPDDAETLVFSSVGYTSEEVAIGNQTVINLKMAPDIQSLSEIVVVGYGTQERSDLTGSVGSVSSEELENVSIASLDQGLQGRVAGVQVTQNAEPGGGVNVLIRGQNSIESGNDPLYVIDGLPVTNAAIAQENDVNSFRESATQNPLAGINPNDIESIEILKDASATAIYGSRGANGVILITTKRGRSGKTKVSYDGYYGVQQVANKLNLLDAAGYANLYNDAAEEDGEIPLFGSTEEGGLPAPNQLPVSTDWQDEAFRIAPIQDHQVSLSGGNDFGRYYVSGNYYDQKGVLEGSQFRRGSLRSNVDFDLGEKVKVGTSITLSHSVNNVGQSGGSRLDGSISAVASALTFAPFLPVRDEEDNYTQFMLDNIRDQPRDNAVAIANELFDKQDNTRLLANVFLTYDIFKDLQLRVSLGGDITKIDRNFYVPRTLVEGFNKSGDATFTTRNNQSWVNENTLTYDKTIGNHQVNVVAGYTLQGARNQFSSIGSTNFGTDKFLTYNLSAGEVLGIPQTNLTEWALVSYLGRVNYGFNDKYLLTLTARADGSSRFGSNNKWSFFPSAAVAWKLGQEEFIQNLGVFDELKLRASYGETGNSGSPYQSLALLNTTNYAYDRQLVIGYYPSRITNQDLRWETVSVLDIGLDMAFLEGRLSFTADYYHKVSNDLLLKVDIPSISGFGDAVLNAGSLENRGFELTGTMVALTGPLKWDFSGNFSLNRNQLTSLGDAKEVIGERVVGEPIGLIYNYEYDGVFQNEEQLLAGPVQKNDRVGYTRYVDQNGDGTINRDDQVIIGNTNPDFIYGLTNNFSYKGFNLSIFFQGMYGHDVLNLTAQDLSNMDPNSNQLAEVAQRRWTPENTNTDVPRAAFANRNNANTVSSRYVEDGSFLRLRNVRLGYNIKLERLNSLELYVSGQNLFTVTNYTGVNPELSREQFTFPLAKIYMVGLGLSF